MILKGIKQKALSINKYFNYKKFDYFGKNCNQLDTHSQLNSKKKNYTKTN